MQRKLNIITRLIILALAFSWSNLAYSVDIIPSPAPNGTKFVAGTHWYTIVYRGQNQSGAYLNINNVNSNNELNWQVKASDADEDASKWCFVGDATTGYLMYNKAAGTSVVLTSNSLESNSRAKMVSKTSDPSNTSHYTWGQMTVASKAQFQYIRLGTTGHQGINNQGSEVAMYNKNSDISAGQNFALEITEVEIIQSGYQVIIKGDNNYQVTASASIMKSGTATTISNGEYLDLNNSLDVNDLRGLSINAPANKFVWGPEIDKKKKTITFTVKDPVTSLTQGKWYQIQVLPKGTRYQGTTNTNNMVESLNGVSQIRRKSNYLYFYQDDTYNNTYPIDIAGYYQDKEAMSYIYVPTVGGSSNQINATFQTATGRYVDYQGKLTTSTGIQSYKLTPESDNSLSWNGGMRPWYNLGSPTHLSLGWSGSNQNVCFYTHFAEVDPTETYDVYKVAITGGDANSMVTCLSSYNEGVSQVYNGGYLFFKKDVTPTWGMFTSNVLKGVNIDISAPDANNIRTITFTENQDHDLNVLKFSDTPSTTNWADNTTWFTWRNNRNNQNGQPSLRYISTSADFVNNNYVMTNSSANYGGQDRGGLWCFVGTEAGFEIYNAAYGPAFKFAFVNNGYTMVPSNDVPSGAVTTFTYESATTGQSQWLDGASHGYLFRIGTTGSNQIHSNSSGLVSWNGGGSLRKDDGGSVFKITQVDYTILDQLPELDIYYSGSAGYTYTGSREIFGKRNTTPYLILSTLEDGEEEITISDINPNTDIERVSVTAIPNSYMKGLVIEQAGMISPSPINGQWAPGTKWYTMRNHRAAKYVSTNNGSIDDNMYLKWSGGDSKPSEAEGMWCFVEDGNNGFRIYNKAYGPNFVLGMVSTSTNAHTRMYHLSEANSERTHFHFVDNTNKYNGKNEYCIILGANSGGTGLNNISNSYLGVWAAQQNNHVGDQGSAFYIERVDEATASAAREYIAYRLETKSNNPKYLNFNFNSVVSYNTQSQQGSKFAVVTGYYMLFDTSVDVNTLSASAFTTTNSTFPSNFSSIEIGTVASTSPELPRITLRGETVLPHVVHRPNGNLWRAKQNNYDGTASNSVGKQTNEYKEITLENGNKVKLQNTSEFEITHFLAPNETRQLWMPTTSSSSMNADAKILNYMRWFDYKTEEIPDPQIVNLAADQVNNLYEQAWFYQNGIVVGSSVNSTYPRRYVQFNMPGNLTVDDLQYEYTLANEATRYTDFNNNFENNTAVKGNASYLGTFSDPNNTAQGNQNLIEPTIGVRQIYHIRSAYEMAEKLYNCTGSKWLEQENITFPVRGLNWKNGKNGQNFEDVIPLDYAFLDYWSYDASGNLTNVRNNGTIIETVVEDNGTGIRAITKNATSYLTGSTGTFVESNNDASREAGHYISFDYPSGGIIPLEEGKSSRTAVIKVYLNVNGVRYNIKKFILNFQAGTEPIPYYEVLGDTEHERSDQNLKKIYGNTENPTGVFNQLNFYHPDRYLMGAPNSSLQRGRGFYAFPYNFEEVSYSYFANGMNWADWGEYAIRNNGATATNTTGFNSNFLSVNYLRLLYEKKNAIKDKEAGEELLRTAQEGFGLSEEERATAISEAEYKIRKAEEKLTLITRDSLEKAYTENYYLYADASEQPGQIGRLHINQKLCTGTRIYGTAWLSASSDFRADSPDPASVIFRFKGVKEDGSMITIYSYCPGQISNVGRDKNRNIVTHHVEEDYNGTSYNEAIWQQVAFSFVNPYPATDFEGFVLEIFNNCRGSSGGDIFLDDIRLYVKNPQVNVENSAPICGEELSIVRISTDFDALMDALQGNNPEGLTTYYGTYAILDKEVYDKYLEKIENPTTTDISTAFNLALIGETNKDNCYVDDKFLPELYAFHDIKFLSNFLSHEHVTYAQLVGDNILETAGYMYQYNTAGEIISRNLVFNCKINSERIAGKKYYLVFHANVEPTDMSKIKEADYHEFFSMADICCIKSEFTTMRAKMINIEGNENLDPYNIDYCPGTAPTISLNSYGYDISGNLIQEHGVYYDWYFGTKEQFKKEYVWLDGKDIDIEKDNPSRSEIITAEDFCMEHCLMNFRHFYPNAGVKELYDGTVIVHHFEKDPNTDTEYELTEKMILKLKEWVEEGKLRLHLTAVNIDLSKVDEEGRTYLLAIQQGAKVRYNYDDDKKENPLIYCIDPVEISFYTKLESPNASVGLDGVDYSGTPYNGFNDDKQVYHSIPLRINKQQIKKIATQESTKLKVPIRVINPSGYYKVNSATGLKDCESIHLEIDPKDNYIYIAETNDPQWQMRHIDGDGGEYLPSIGKLVGIDANKQRTEGINYLEIIFNGETLETEHKFVPREGYYYILRTQFTEEVNEGTELAKEYEVPKIKCKGNILIPLKIVPEYVKWTGRENNNWNNDRNWIRADYREIVPSDEQNFNNTYTDYQANTKESEAYNENNGFNGYPISANDNKQADEMNLYIPMDQPSISTLYNTFAYAPMKETSVIIPSNPARYPIITTHAKSEEIGKQGLLVSDASFTPYIEYDMVVVNDNTNFSADKYYENTIKNINFCPASLMGNSHKLIYEKAWVEYNLDTERWYTLGSPLKNVFSGDWFSPSKGGKELSPLFKDIRYNENHNDRFRPAYFQRSWDKQGNNIVYKKDNTTNNSYVKAEWSDVYNDAEVEYSEGGYSIKPETGYMPLANKPNDGKVLVRLPKADTSYKYYDIQGATGQAPDAQLGVTRTNRLLSDDLKLDGTGNIEMNVLNQTTGNRYYLISNPFMAYMDMTTFFSENDHLEPKYWIVDNNHQNVSIKYADSEEWISTSSNGRYVAPLQGFFVKLKDSEDTSGGVDLVYNEQMQTTYPVGTDSPIELKSKRVNSTNNSVEKLEIITEFNGIESKAIVAQSSSASNQIINEEDCETFIDGNLTDYPSVYTTADGQAMSINLREKINMVPLGILSKVDTTLTLQFNLSNIKEPIYLYDNINNEYNEISNESQITISTNNNGRYFITHISLDDKLEETTNSKARKGVWSVSGAYCGETINGLMPGIYIVNGVKMIVR